LAVLPASGFSEEIACPPNLGAVTVDNVIVNGTCRMRLTTVEGNIVVDTGGSLLAQGVSVNGSVQSSGAQRVRIVAEPNTGTESFVNGDVQIKNTSGSLKSLVNNSEIGGTVLLDDNQVPFDVFGNTVGADVQVFQNDAVVRIRDNTIDGNLQCKENTPAPVNGGGNVVAGNAEDQCAGFDN
jgi:hypothetical protein